MDSSSRPSSVGHVGKSLIEFLEKGGGWGKKVVDVFVMNILF